MLFGVCDLLWVTDRPALFLGEQLQKRALDSGCICLNAYANRRRVNIERERVNYKMRPKWHSLCHIIFEYQRSDENSRNHKTLAEEDALGKLTRIASACHGGSVIKRFFERYVLFCALHWENLENQPEEAVRESW